jgi:Holliday junction resolvase
MKTKAPTDFIKVNKIRRSRGYSFEYETIEDLKGIGWKAKRLGGSSANLPDILATHDDTIYAMEAKSVMMPRKIYAYIPQKQIVRCIETLDMFPIYKHRYLVFGFKFSQKHVVGFPKYYFFGFHRNNTGVMAQFNLFENYYVRCDQFGTIKLVALEWTDPSQGVPISTGCQTNKLPFFPTNLNGDFAK